jgi:ABC-type dipeptide/oligopeptide/nickel transport system permease subunit
MSTSAPLQLRASAWMALGLLLLIALAVVVGPWLSPHAPDAIDFAAEWGSAPDRMHWFGTDSAGRTRGSSAP